MLSYDELVALERHLRDELVLSVYVNGRSTDPAARDRWRTELRNALADVESWLRGSSHAEREAFDSCREMALGALSGFLANDGKRGWAGFFTAKGPAHMGAIPVAISTMASWSTGPNIAPYIRALKEGRPVVVAIVDSSEASIYRYAEKQAQLVETIERELILQDPSYMSRPPRQGFHGGTRGSPGTDVMQRESHNATDRMLAGLAGRLGALSQDAWIVIGGIPTVAAAALKHLAPSVATRATHAERLDVHASEAQVAEVARHAASRLRDADDLEHLNEAVAASEAGGAGVTGAVDTAVALENRQVRDLFVTQRFLDEQAADANAAVRRAFAQGADVRHLSGAAAERLDTLGGIAARLRYAVPRESVIPAAAEAPA